MRRKGNGNERFTIHFNVTTSSKDEKRGAFADEHRYFNFSPTLITVYGILLIVASKYCNQLPFCKKALLTSYRPLRIRA